MTRKKKIRGVFKKTEKSQKKSTKNVQNIKGRNIEG